LGGVKEGVSNGFSTASPYNPHSIFSCRKNEPNFNNRCRDATKLMMFCCNMFTQINLFSNTLKLFLSKTHRTSFNIQIVYFNFLFKRLNILIKNGQTALLLMIGLHIYPRLFDLMNDFRKTT
jgi:hypothetical protein